jgi:hypothetical protein
MGKMVICSKYKILICSKYINQCEIRLHKRFYMFDCVYYNNTIFHFHSSNHTLSPVLPMNTTYTTAKTTVVEN